MTSGEFVRRLLVTLLAVGVLVPFVGAAPAGARVDPNNPRFYQVDVINVTKNSNVVRYDQVLGRCGGYQGGITCTVRAERSATRTIGTSFGLSVAGVGATLGISSSRSVTIGTSCSLTTRPPTYPWVLGYAHGTTYRYTVRQRIYEYGRLVQTRTSAQSAFNPTGIRCGLSG